MGKGTLMSQVGIEGKFVFPSWRDIYKVAIEPIRDVTEMENPWFPELHAEVRKIVGTFFEMLCYKFNLL